MDVLPACDNLHLPVDVIAPECIGQGLESYLNGFLYCGIAFLFHIN
jgi:hypothetical protein